jgi:6-phosphofructokinase 2
MSSIITITFNPVIDKSTTVTELLPDKKMRCTSPVYEPGGGGINVSRAIKKLGGESHALFLAGGHSGKFLQQLLDKEQIHYTAVPITGFTRENLIVYDTKNEKQYRFGMPGPVVLETEWKALLDVLEKMENVSFMVVSGAVPEGVPSEIFAHISRIARTKNAKLVADTSGEPLKHVLREGVFFVKPNIGELCSLTNKKWIQDDEVESTAREILKNSNCVAIAISMGEKGALVVTANESVRLVPPQLEKKSTVGAGDSMVAGIIFALSKGWPPVKAAQYGVACGTAATLNPGTQLFNPADVERIFPMIVSKHETVTS